MRTIPYGGPASEPRDGRVPTSAVLFASDSPMKVGRTGWIGAEGRMAVPPHWNTGVFRPPRWNDC